MKHKPKAKGSIIAALDVGSSKIACFIARIVDDEGNFEVLGVGHQASQGVKAGSVIDLDAAESGGGFESISGDGRACDPSTCGTEPPALRASPLSRGTTEKIRPSAAGVG